MPAEGGACGAQGPLQGVPSSDQGRGTQPELPRLLSFPAASPSVTVVEHGQGEPVRGDTGPLGWPEIQNRENKIMIRVIPFKV